MVLRRSDHIKRLQSWTERFDAVKVMIEYFNEERSRWKTAAIDPEWDTINPRAISLHHGMTSTKLDEYMLTIDIDASSLTRACEIASLIKEEINIDFFIKYSGNTGLHLMTRIVGNDKIIEALRKRKFQSVRMFAKSVIIDIFKRLDDPRLTLSPELKTASKDKILLDLQIHRPKHLIRSLWSLHEKSNLYSIPIEPDWSPTMIRKMATRENMDQLPIDMEIPIFSNLKYGRSSVIEYQKRANGDLPPVRDIETSSPALKVLIKYVEESPSCIRAVLATPAASHSLRFWVSVKLMNVGFNWSLIKAFWKKVLTKNKYEHFIYDEEQTIDSIRSKRYRATCHKMQMHGFCVDGCKLTLEDE